MMYGIVLVLLSHFSMQLLIFLFMRYTWRIIKKNAQVESQYFMSVAYIIWE